MGKRGPKPVPLETRLLRHIDKNTITGCWNWSGSTSGKGYGKIGLGGRCSGHEYVHRVAYELWCEPIPEGKHILHSCDNKLCCNPDHLRVGDNSDNMIDVSKRAERNATLKLTPDQALSIWHDPRTQQEIADDYGISQITVSNIKTRKSWRWLTC